MTGFDAVEAAADKAALERGPDPVENMITDPCPELERELDVFVDDPITQFYGLQGDMDEWGPLLTRNHVARHGCQGWGQA
jgi:hypothetical protein